MDKSNTGLWTKTDTDSIVNWEDLAPKYVWEGLIQINGGWGCKNAMLPICSETINLGAAETLHEDLIFKDVKPEELFIVPVGQDTDAKASAVSVVINPDGTVENKAEAVQGYMVKFIGSEFDKFEDLIKQITKHPEVDNIVVDLHSYFEDMLHQAPRTIPMYRVVYTWGLKGPIEKKVYQCEWLPSFKKNLLAYQEDLNG